MRTRKHLLHIGLIILIFASCPISVARELIQGNTQLKNRPYSKEVNKALGNLFHSIESAVPEYDIEFTQKELSRSLREISRGDADFHYPIVCTLMDEIVKDYLKISEVSLGKIPFLIVSRADKPITKEDITDAKYSINDSSVHKLEDKFFNQSEKTKLLKYPKNNLDESELVQHVSKVIGRELNALEIDDLLRSSYPYKVVVDRAHRSFIQTPSISGNSPISSIRRLAGKRIDAVIDDGIALQTVVENEEMESQVFVDVFEAYDMCFLVANTPRGETIEKILNDAFVRLNKAGVADQILGYHRQRLFEFIQSYSATEDASPTE